jgi:type II secretion system protein D
MKTRRSRPSSTWPPAFHALRGEIAVLSLACWLISSSMGLAQAPVPVPPGPPATTDASATASDEIQLSFQGANVDMVVQWLAKVTGKSVIKHPRAQCQVTIVSSKPIKTREALSLLYRALSLEGFNVIESAKSILIVPEGQEPKMNPELVDPSSKSIPEGRQRLIKIFPLKHLQPAEIKEKLKVVLSEKAIVDLDERAQQLVVTDYNDNLRLVAEMIQELDVASASESIIEIYALKYAEGDEIANLLGLILNAQTGGSTSSRGSSGGNSPMPMPMPMPEPQPGGGPSGKPSANTASGVKIWPDKIANRLIITTPKSKWEEIKKLIDLLDTQKPQDVSVRVINLKHVNAGELMKEIGPLYQKMSGKSMKEVIEVAANEKSNSLIVLASEVNFQSIQKLIQSLDTDDAQDKEIKTFALKNADAEDVAKQLQDLVGENKNTSRYFYFSYPSDGKQAKKTSVVADRRRNSVVVQGPPSAMEGIEQMIKELDEPVGDNSLAPKIIRLKYVSAVDLEEVLNELFLKKTQARTYWFYDDDPPETANRDVGRLYGKVRITSEPYSNSLIITSNSPENLGAVEEVIKDLDVPSQAGETTLRVPLKFAEAINIASSLNILFAKGGSPPLRQVPQQGNQGDNRNQQQQNNNSQGNFILEKETKEDAYFPWLGGQAENTRSGDGRTNPRQVSDLVGRVRVVPDRRSNSLLVTANMHFFPQVMKLINDMDAPTAQVLIEARIIEVSSDFRDKMGVRWSADGENAFSAEDKDGALLAGGTKGSAAGSPAVLGSFRKIFTGSSGSGSLKSGVLDASMNLDVLVQFLRKNTDATVMAEPQLNIADNELGKLFVGAQVPFISGSLNTDVGGRNDTFQYKDVGVILEVTPHINSSEEVALKVRVESSSIRNGETLFGGAILDTRNFRTDLMMKSGETLVLGGIIQKENQNVIRKVPVLGSIPGLGWAFKKKDKVTREVELMVFLRPVVTRTPEQARQLLLEVEKKTPRINQANEPEQPDDSKKKKK